jgi:formylglycine-generating enzyme required for sulfatase activity
MKKTFLFSLAFLACICLPAQQIQNVTAEQQGKNIVVSYNLAAASGQFDVALYCSTDGGTNFGNPLNAVTGDVGKNLNAGNNKQITWNVLADMEKLTGSRIVFEVRARTTSDLGIEMVFVKGGTFNMGSNNGGDDEEPAHMVRLHDFYMGKYEVTQKQWREVMGASTTLSDPAYFKNCDNCPVEQVSWNDVREFIKKLNQKTDKTYRLPTEAEWEYAAGGGSSTQFGGRSGGGYKYSGSNNIDEVAWYNNNPDGKTHPVGQKKANELGIYDMSGNVWEWCADWYKAEYYDNSPQGNPKGPTSGTTRVIRGGSWDCDSQYCRVADRSYFTPDRRSYGLGFRLVLVP